MPIQLTGRNKNVAERLSALLKDKPVAFVGSGLSPNCFPKGWETLVNILSARLNLVPEASNLPAKAQQLKDHDPTAYESTLRQIFSQQPSPLPEDLLKLTKLPFEAYVTTNYDHSISRARASNTGQNPREQRYPNINPIDCSDGSITYVHGSFQQDMSIEDIDYLVLHTDSYHRAYVNNSPHPATTCQFLRFLFKYKHTLFVGHGLTHDEPMMRLLLEAKDESSTKTALLPYEDIKGEHDRISHSYKHAYNVDILYYDRIDTNYSGLTSLLDVVHDTCIPEPQVIENTLREDSLWP